MLGRSRDDSVNQTSRCLAPGRGSAGGNRSVCRRFSRTAG